MPLSRLEKDTLLKAYFPAFMAHHGEDFLGLKQAAEAIEIAARDLGGSAPIPHDKAKALRRDMTFLIDTLTNTDMQFKHGVNYASISAPERIAIGNSPLTLGALKDLSERLNHEGALLLREEVRDKITAMPALFERLFNRKTGIGRIIPGAGMDIQALLIANYGPTADNDLLPPVNSAALANPTTTTSPNAVLRTPVNARAGRS